MAKITNWSDDYWLLILQAYLAKPAGVKPVYSKVLVDLGTELHIHPAKLQAKMAEMDRRESPQLQHLWDTYHGNARRLNKAVRQLREMKGFNSADAFYDGVQVNETFEKDFRPVAPGTTVTPAALILVLNLYFQLTPATMVAHTPEVVELARLIKLRPEEVVEILDVYQHCDPYLNRRGASASPLAAAGKEVWQRFALENPDSLEALARALAEYFK